MNQDLESTPLRGRGTRRERCEVSEGEITLTNGIQKARKSLLNKRVLRPGNEQGTRTREDPCERGRSVSPPWIGNECRIILLLPRVTNGTNVAKKRMHQPTGAENQYGLEEHQHDAQQGVHSKPLWSLSKYKNSLRNRQNGVAEKFHCAWPRLEQHRPCEQYASLSRRSAMRTPTSCQQSVVCHETVAARERRFPTVWCRGRAAQPSPCPDHHVEGRSDSYALHHKSAASRHTGFRTRCAMVAKGIQGTATFAQTESEGEREAETLEEDPEQSGAEVGEEARGGERGGAIESAIFAQGSLGDREGAILWPFFFYGERKKKEEIVSAHLSLQLRQTKACSRMQPVVPDHFGNRGTAS